MPTDIVWVGLVDENNLQITSEPQTSYSPIIMQPSLGAALSVAPYPSVRSSNLVET